MGYCFMGFEKIHTKTELVGKYKHNYRKEETLNADPEKAHLNEELVKLYDDNPENKDKTYADKFEEKMKKLEEYNPNIRKNAVMALEVVTTFSREDKEKIDLEKWKKDQVKWLKETWNANPEKYGDNVISVMFHGDETGNVHCHAMVIPIDDKGKLNSSYYINGRQKIIEMQDSYAKLMNENHNLERGLKGSKASHKDLKKFYAGFNNANMKKAPEILIKNGRKETVEEYKERVDEVISQLNVLLFKKELSEDRKDVEKQTLDYNEKVKFYKDKEEFERTIGSIENFKEIKQKARTFDYLNEGLSKSNEQEQMNMFKKMQHYINIGKDAFMKKEKEKAKKKKINESNL